MLNHITEKDSSTRLRCSAAKSAKSVSACMETAKFSNRDRDMGQFTTDTIGPRAQIFNNDAASAADFQE